jgi:EAL domain-containing protein (putative c-di-GMP-specific phosphodiesterase class I)
MKDRVAQQALDRALDEKDLLLVYQPIHDATTRAIYGAEALLRQRRQSGEVREAGIITRAAEKGPEMYALDSWLVRTAYTHAAQWMSHGAPDVRLHVNLSPREFEQGHMLHRLKGLVTSCGIDTQRINLEITETSYIAHPKETMVVLEQIKALGIHLWLDDFGTGHSSITHLQHFPLDGLKIPGSFVSNLATDPRCRAITRRLIELAHDLGLEVIAEGVETDRQLEFLREEKCDYIQGFLFSKPMEFDEFLKALPVKGDD